MLKKISLGCLFALTFSFFSLTVGATNYYVSSSGNDSNSGTDASSPWQTINKVNSFKGFGPGDNIYFRSGESFYGNIIVNNSGAAGNPITYGAYGSGAKPIITGFTTVDSWTNLGGNIWESNNRVSSLSSCNMVVINGVNVPMGRYPNDSYLTYQTFSGNSSITSSSLGSTNWAGAEVVIKKRLYVIDRSPIISQSGTTLYYKSATAYSGQAGFGFFIQNDSRTLDKQNEWYFNSATGKIKIFSYSTPGNVQVSGIDNLVTGIYQSNISFNNLSFAGANSNGFSIASCANFKIQNCTVDFCNNGISGADKGVPSSNFSVSNSTINHSNNIAINLTIEFNSATITNNVIKNSGLIPGMAKIGDVSYQGVYTAGNNTMISYNEIDSSGYNGISFNSSAKVMNNFVRNYCMVKDDGAGIYTTSEMGGSVINNNIVLNAIGNGEGTPWPDARPLAEGIYLDSYANGIEVSNNSIANIPRIGIYLHNIRNVVVKNNTVFNAGFHALEVKNSVSSTIISGLTITNNILFTKDPSEKPVRYYSTHNDLSDFGTIDYNYYAKSTDDSFLINLLPSGDGKGEYNYTLAQWQKFSGNDMNSKTFSKTLSDLNDLRFEYNATNENKTISLDANYVDLANISYNGNITLAPYTSAILIKNGPIEKNALLPASNPSNTTNGLDYKYYEASAYSSVPSFNGLTSVKTGTANNFDISQSNRSTAFSFNFTGYIDVPSDGQYTFYTTSDDGSNLYIDGTLVVNNDAIQAATEKSGVVGLKAGKHAISVGYFQQSGDKILSASYSGPGISKQNIPNSSLYRISTSSLLPAVNPSNTVNGLDYKYYEASAYSSVPSFAGLTPVKTGTASGFDISLANRSTAFSFNFTGYIDVPSDGQYTFYTTSDDGSNLYIDGTLVVNNDAIQVATEKSGVIGLKAGKHAISVGYFQQNGDKILLVSYSGPGINKQNIPTSALYRTSQYTLSQTGLLPAVNPSNTVSGLDYKYYEAASYSSLPSFNGLTPVKTGTANNFDISVANRSTAYSFNFTGYIDVPSDGQYTFYTTSDDGSNLYIDNILVVNNDGLHSAKELSGVIGLQAGKHAISVGYFQQGWDNVLSVSYAGPGVGKQNIPASALYRLSQTGLLPALNPSNLVNGIDYRYYEDNSYSSVPSFNGLTPVKSGTGNNFDVSLANRSEAFSFNFSGYIDISVDGQYTFYTTSDDGSNLYIDNVLVVDNDGLHSARERYGVIGLQAGKHAISVGYFQQGWDNTLSVSYAGPVTSKQVIPEKYLYRIQGKPFQRSINSVTSSAVEMNDDNSVVPNDIVNNSNQNLLIKADPNPFNNLINVTISGLSKSKFQLTLLNAIGQVVWVKNIDNGSNFYSEVINTPGLARGIYFLRFVQDNKNHVLKLIKQY